MEQLKQRYRKTVGPSNPSIKLSMSIKKDIEEIKNRKSKEHDKDEPIVSSAEKSTARSDNKEIVENLLSELAAIESKVGGSGKASFTSGGYTQDQRRYFKEIAARTNKFKTGKGKAGYLLKELESAMGKIDTLESNIRALKKENENWRNVIKASSNNKTNIGNEKLKEEVSYLKSIISEQHIKLETFKREVIEKFCRRKH